MTQGEVRPLIFGTSLMSELDHALHERRAENTICKGAE